MFGRVFLLTLFGNRIRRSVSEVLEIVETSQDALDALWRCEALYPQIRMANLLEVISAAFARYIESKLGAMDLFNENFVHFR